MIFLFGLYEYVMFFFIVLTIASCSFSVNLSFLGGGGSFRGQNLTSGKEA